MKTYLLDFRLFLVLATVFFAQNLVWDAIPAYAGSDDEEEVQGPAWPSFNKEKKRIKLEDRFGSETDLPTLSSTSIPKKIHYIWVGPKKLPVRFLNNILSIAYRNSDYQIKVWMQKPNTFAATAALSGATIPANLRIHSIEPVLTKMPSGFRSLTEREMAGSLANYAAASDILRIFILDEEGGIYLDTDIRARDIGIEDFNELGTNAAGMFEYRRPSIQKALENYARENLRSQGNSKIKFHSIGTLSPRFGFLYHGKDKANRRFINNDVLASTPNHPILIMMKNKMAERFLTKEAEDRDFFWQGKREYNSAGELYKYVELLTEQCSDIKLLFEILDQTQHQNTKNLKSAILMQQLLKRTTGEVGSCMLISTVRLEATKFHSGPNLLAASIAEFIAKYPELFKIDFTQRYLDEVNPESLKDFIPTIKEKLDAELFNDLLKFTELDPRDQIAFEQHKNLLLSKWDHEIFELFKFDLYGLYEDSFTFPLDGIVSSNEGSWQRIWKHQLRSSEIH